MPAPLGLVVCGAPLASRADDVARALARAGWPLAVGLTDAGAAWIDSDAFNHAATVAGSRRQQGAGEDRSDGRPGLVVACPLTFNTANKIASGIMDNKVTGTLCDAIGVGAPIIAVPFVNDRLWGHPAWSTTLDTLGHAGVVFLDPHTGRPGEPVAVRSGTGGDVVDAFDPAWVVTAVGRSDVASA